MQKDKIEGIGIDIEDIGRFSNLDFKKNRPFFNKIYTKKEIRYCLSKARPSQHFASKFAGKEAVIKALGNKSKITHNQIEVLNDKDGMPIVNLKNKNANVKISLSHSEHIATAVAIISTHGQSQKNRSKGF